MAETKEKQVFSSFQVKSGDIEIHFCGEPKVVQKYFDEVLTFVKEITNGKDKRK